MRYWLFGDSVQSCSNNHIPPNATEMTKADFNAFIAALPPPEPGPPEIDPIAELSAKVAKLETDVANIKAGK